MEVKKVFEGSVESYAEYADAKPPLRRIRIWDLPTRFFHWALAVGVLTAFVTGQLGGNLMEIHAKAGLMIIGLVIFRVVWGFVGSTHARFKNFAPSPKNIRSYFKGQWQGVGHNPLGAISVFAMLILLAIQAILGLFSNDDITFDGPLSGLINKTLSDRLTGFHHLLSNFLLALIVVHIAAIIFYLWFKKDNLVKPMLTGRKEVRIGNSATKVNLISLIAAIGIAFIAVYIASGLSR